MSQVYDYPSFGPRPTLVRKGAGLGNFLWADSQDMAGVDKVILRGCTVWLIGVQREANEIKRNLLNIPASIQRPKPAQIATLKKGEFFACWKDRTVKVYVQPAWMEAAEAQAIAKGEQKLTESIDYRRRQAPPPPVQPTIQPQAERRDPLGVYRAMTPERIEA